MEGLFKIKIMVSQLNHHITSVKKCQVKLICMNDTFSRKGKSLLQRCQNIQTVFIDLAFQSPDLTGLNMMSAGDAYKKDG
jgi:hypothetical protein